MPIALDWGQAISLGGCPRRLVVLLFFLVVPPFWIVFLDCFFSFFPEEKNKKNKKKQHKKKGYHEPPRAPPRLIACPPSRAIGTVWSFDQAALVGFWESWSQLGSRQRSRLWTLRASGINKLRRLGRSTKSLWVSNRALFIVVCFVYCCFIVFVLFFVCFFGLFFLGLFFWFVFFVFFCFFHNFNYFPFSNEWRSLDTM